ncbi:hypothetical protein CVT24_010026, partial [Panaeolus cyanescens]
MSDNEAPPNPEPTVEPTPELEAANVEPAKPTEPTPSAQPANTGNKPDWYKLACAEAVPKDKHENAHLAKTSTQTAGSRASKAQNFSLSPEYFRESL